MHQAGALYCYCGTRIPVAGIIEHLEKCTTRADNSPLATLSRRLKESSSLEQLKLYLQELQAEQRIVGAYIQSKEPAKPVIVNPVPRSEIPNPDREEAKRVRKIPEEKPRFPPVSEERKIDQEVSVALKPRPAPQRSPSPEVVDPGIKCNSCNKVWDDFASLMFLDVCSHIVCITHFQTRFEETYKRNQCLKCPVEECGGRLTEMEMKHAVGVERVEALMRALAVGDGDVVANCQCGYSVAIEPGRVELNKKDQNGVQLSREAAEHLAKYRFRCPKCALISCAKCNSAPYHEGMTCEQFAVFKVAKKCKYCGDKLPNGSEVCAKPECHERLTRSCKKKLPCGHSCYGVQEESHCPPCLNEACAGEHNEYEYCAICYSEGLGSAPVVQLECGHFLHQHCLAASLANRWVGPRITFKFAKCPSCNEWAITPNNRELLAKVQVFKALYDDILDKALKRLKYEGEDKNERIMNPSDKNYYNQPQKYALDRLCYYECFKCKRPYFGGKKDCGQDNDGKKFDPQELVCPACVAESMPGTANCPKHGIDYIEFKCKFCCNVAAWFCWGNTHFCEDCHTKQNNGDYISRKARDQLPKCPGVAKCPLKLRHPPNGEEFALGCTMCRNQVGDF